ncbi:ABC transporter ATP-binding protein/permease [Streptococcus pneumoniae]|nr:ABC transporter ATP-binding protein/permease [Streptococcus pneumoniae]
MKHLLSYFKPYIKESILAPLFKLLEAVFELLVPMVIAGIVDQSLPQGDQGHLWMQIGLLLMSYSFLAKGQQRPSDNF